MTDSAATYTGVIWLQGKKTILRPIEESDVAQITKWINDPETRKFLGVRNPMSSITEHKWYQYVSKRDTSDIVIAVCTLDGTFIGTMGLHHIDLINRNAVTGAMFGHPNYLGKGYGTDAKMHLLAHAFLELGLEKVRSEVLDFNQRSIAYSKKCGYLEEGVFKRQVYRNGTWHDMVQLAVFKETWLPLWETYNAS